LQSAQTKIKKIAYTLKINIMKIATIIVRILLGLLFLWSSLAYFFHLYPEPAMTGAVKTFNEGMKASVYLFPLVKITELVCGISFISGRFVTLAAVLIFPNIVNIVLFHVFLAPAELPVAIFVLLADLFIAYNYRKNYASLFIAK
jgi:putative oxidoreductase